MGDEVISEGLGPADAARWRATLEADRVRQEELRQQWQGAQLSDAYVQLMGGKEAQKGQQ